MSVAPFPSLNTLYTPPKGAVGQSLGHGRFPASWKNGTLSITLWYETNQTNWYYFEASENSNVYSSVYSNVYVTHERNLSTGIITRLVHSKKSHRMNLNDE
jgi:hypothetical protein